MILKKIMQGSASTVIWEKSPSALAHFSILKLRTLTDSACKEPQNKDQNFFLNANQLFPVRALIVLILALNNEFLEIIYI